jgi:hypothetical protein
MLWMKLHFHFAKVGLSCLNIFPLRSFQMFQHAIIITSIKKGPEILFSSGHRWLSAVSNWPINLKIIPNSVTKVTSENRCSLSSYILVGRSLQCLSSATFQFRLTNQSFVFSRWLSSNQAKTFVFIMHVDYQIHLHCLLWTLSKAF